MSRRNLGLALLLMTTLAVGVYAKKQKPTSPADDQKRALYRRIAELLAQNAGIRPQDVMISLVENALVDWSFGEGVAHYMPA